MAFISLLEQNGPKVCVMCELKSVVIFHVFVYWAAFQGLMFGYATDETEECMPLTIMLAHKLNAKMAELRRNGVLPWLRPDSKTQVSPTSTFSATILSSVCCWCL